jgi:hypothetical protein
MADVFSTFETEVENRHKEMLDDLESISLDDLKAKGLTLAFGGKTFKFSDIEIIEDETLEQKLRTEYKEKLNNQQQRIREKINAKINQLLLMHQQKSQELDRKEQQIKRKYRNMAMMPEITEKHMMKGLSVVKGSANDELIWVYKAVYNPRFIVIYEEGFGSRRKKERKPIPARLVTRLKKEIYILVSTKGERVLSVHTKETKKKNDFDIELPAFQHYHQTGTSDCWGSWSYSESWNNPNDILKIAKEAEAVLETINQGSIAKKGPAGLPRLQTLLDAVESIRPESIATTREDLDNDDVWQAV